MKPKKWIIPKPFDSIFVYFIWLINVGFILLLQMALNVILSGKVNHLFIYIFYKELIGMNISKSYVGILFSYCEVISVNTKLWLTFNVFLYERFNYLYFSQDQQWSLWNEYFKQLCYHSFSSRLYTFEGSSLSYSWN